MPRFLSYSIAAALLGSTAVATSALSVSAQTSDQRPQLTLIDTDFSFDAGGDLRLEYVLTGIDLELLDLGTPSPPTTPAPPPTTPDGTTDPPPTPEPEPLVQLTVEVTNYAPITDPSDVDAVVGSGVDPTAFDSVVDGVAITDIREQITLDGDEARFTLEVGTDVEPSVEDRLRFDEAGIYPVRVQVLVGDPDADDVIATAGTIVERLRNPDDAAAVFDLAPPPIDLAVATVIEAPPIEASSAELAAASRELLESIDAAGDLESTLTLEVPPHVMASVIDDAADPAAVRDSLVGDEFVSLPILPLDVSAAVAVGRADQYTRLLNAGEDLLGDLAPSTPTRREVWVAVDPLSAAGAQHLRDLGSRYVAMTEALYADTISEAVPPPDQFVDAVLPDGSAMPILVIDTLGGDLDESAADDILRTSTDLDWATVTVGRLLVEQRTADRRLQRPAQRSHVLAAPDLGAPDTRLLGRLEALVTRTPSIRFAAASSLAPLTDTFERGGEPVTVVLPASAGPELFDRLERIEAAAISLASAASMLPDDDPRRTEWLASLDELISTGFTDAEAQERVDELLAEADRLTSAVQLPDPFAFTLTGRSGTIEVRLTNTSDESLQVVLALDSTKLDFPDGEQGVLLRPRGETTVNVPVEARSNGTSSVTVSVSTPLGEQLDEPVVLTSRVTALTGLGQVLTGGFILVLLTWWFAHWRTRRRDALADDGRARHPSSRVAGVPDEVGSDPL